ncbi:MAG: hypothetical protein FJX52_15495 [Alphaproteobacteria bacterium]|nr:hypothetical protein [Alphaproteobacteria bacterium]
MINKFLIKDGQGGDLGDLGNPTKTMKRAASRIGCPAARLHIVNTGDAVYWFDSGAADAAYWIAALDVAKVLFAGKPGC